MAKYKGWTIEKQYLPGADFTVRNGVVVNRKPRNCDIDFYQAEKDGMTLRELDLVSLKQSIQEIEAIK